MNENCLSSTDMHRRRLFGGRFDILITTQTWSKPFPNLPTRPFINMYIMCHHAHIIKLQERIYTTVSFHGCALPPPCLTWVDSAATGGFCWRGLWEKVCFTGPLAAKSRWFLSRLSLSSSWWTTWAFLKPFFTVAMKPSFGGRAEDGWLILAGIFSFSLISGCLSRSTWPKEKQLDVSQ